MLSVSVNTVSENKNLLFLLSFIGKVMILSGIGNFLIFKINNLMPEVLEKYVGVSCWLPFANV